MEEQQFNLREGAEIIIATPGRLKDVIDRHVLVLSQCRYVVMDEADRMVHLGFEADLTFILDSLPADAIDSTEHGMEVDSAPGQQGKTRVTTLFSATMPPAVERLSRKYLRKPAVITIGEAGRAVDTVEQRVDFVNGDEKKKYAVVVLDVDSEIYSFPQATNGRNPEQRWIFTSNYCLCQSEENCGHGCQGYFPYWRTSDSNAILLVNLILIFLGSGAQRLYILGRIRSSEKLPLLLCGVVTQTFS